MKKGKMMFKRLWRSLFASFCFFAGFCSAFAMEKERDLEEGKPVTSLIEQKTQSLDGQYYFGVIYEINLKDFIKAVQCYFYAAVRGHKRSLDALERLNKESNDRHMEAEYIKAAIYFQSIGSKYLEFMEER